MGSAEWVLQPSARIAATTSSTVTASPACAQTRTGAPHWCSDRRAGLGLSRTDSSGDSVIARESPYKRLAIASIAPRSSNRFRFARAAASAATDSVFASAYSARILFDVHGEVVRHGGQSNSNRRIRLRLGGEKRPGR
jgi:hypothetical protein